MGDENAYVSKSIQNIHVRCRIVTRVESWFPHYKTKLKPDSLSGLKHHISSQAVQGVPLNLETYGKYLFERVWNILINYKDKGVYITGEY